MIKLKNENAMEDKVFAVLKNYNISKKDIPIILANTEFVTIKSGNYFLKSNEKCQKLGVLIDGLMLANYETENGDKIVSRFFYSNSPNIFVTSLKSFKLGVNSNEDILAKEDSTLFVFTKSKLDYLYSAIGVMNEIGRHLAEESYIQALEKIKILQTKKSSDRIDWFKSEFPGLITRINKSDLASYLGMHRNSVNNYLR